LQDTECASCKLHIVKINTAQAEDAIQQIIHRETDGINHPVNEQNEINIIKELLKIKTDKEKANYLAFIEKIFPKFINEDYLSQCVALSPTWNSIIANSMASNQGALHFSSDIFGKPAIEHTLLQKKLLNTTLQYRYQTMKYDTKNYCKLCYENNEKKLTLIHHRQKYCQNDKNHLVKDHNNRFQRHYYRDDKDNTMIVEEDDFRIYSLLEYFSEEYKKKIDAIKRVNENLKKVPKKKGR
jgi:hypothetical protein